VDAERLNLWKDTFRYYRLAYYYELLSSTLARRWDRWQSVTNFLIALTSSSSVISGWAFWKNDGAGRFVWAGLAAAASGLSIFQSTFDIESRIKKQRLLRKQFSQIRAALQIVLSDIVSGQDLLGIDSQLDTQRTRYFALTASFDPDITETRGLRKRVEADRDIVLHELGLFERGIIDEGKNDDNDSTAVAARE
jgi:hypothetical protein